MRMILILRNGSGKLNLELDEQMKDEARLNELIRKNLARVEVKG